MPDYAVSTKFKASDNVTATYERMGRAADKFRSRTSSAFRNATKEGYKFGTIVKGILAANAIRGGISLISRGIQTATTDFLSFDDTMVAAAARFDDIGPKAKNFAGQLAALKRGTIAALAGTEFSPVDAAKAMDFFAKANWRSDIAMQSLVPMMNIATAAGEDFAQTTDMTNDLLGAFGLRVDNAAKQMQFLGRMADVLTRSGLDANGGLVDMFETMKTVGPIASTVGASLEDVAAMQVLLANAGLKGTMAATGLKHALLNIPGRKMAAEFAANGVAIADASGNIRDYFDILEDVRKKTAKLGNREQAQIFERIFGLYGIASGANLLKGLDTVRKVISIAPRITE